MRHRVSAIVAPNDGACGPPLLRMLQLIDAEPAEPAQRILLDAAVLMFQSGELSAGAAVEFAGVERFTFLVECQRRSVSTVNYPAEELAEEVAALR